MLASEYGLPLSIVAAILQCHTREGAVRVLENCKGITADGVNNNGGEYRIRKHTD